MKAPHELDHGGRRFAAGEEIEIPDSAADHYVAAGWIAADKPKKPKPVKSAKAKPAKQTEEAPSADEQESTEG